MTTSRWAGLSERTMRDHPSTMSCTPKASVTSSSLRVSPRAKTSVPVRTASSRSLPSCPFAPVTRRASDIELLAGLGVLGLGRSLLRTPPRLVVAVPLHRCPDPSLEVGVLRHPAELSAQLGAVDRVATVVPRPVRDELEAVLRTTQLAQHGGHDVAVAPLAVGTDQVGLTGPALLGDGPHGCVVVVDVDPVAHVEPVAVELRCDPVDDVRDLPRDELLDVLVRAVVVGAVADRCADAERADPGAHQQVAAGFRRGV